MRITAVETIESALARIPPHDREVWVRVGMAIKSELGDAGFSTWDAWAQGAPSHSPKASKDVWKSISAEGKTTIATLFQLATNAGWTPSNAIRQRTTVQAVEQQPETARQPDANVDDKVRRQERAARRAKQIWEAAEAADDTHPYLVRKGVKAHGLRRGEWTARDESTGELLTIRDALLIPIMSSPGDIVSLQAIFPDAVNPIGRDKDYLAGGRKTNGYLALGRIAGETDTVLVCEGYATGATLHEATQHPVMIAFDAGNLNSVARTVREKLPAVRILIAADNDQFTTRRDGSPWNPGTEAAHAAAKAVGAIVAVPTFTDVSTQPTDFNDLQRLEGTEAVVRSLEAAFRSEPQQVAENVLSKANTGGIAPMNHPPETQPSRAHEFGVPVDVFGTLPPPQLPLEVLPDSLIAYVADQAELLGCDQSIIGLASVVSAAACITDGIELQPKRNDPTWTESSRLWVAVVGDPSTKKTPAIGKAVRCVKRIDHRFADQNDAAYADWKWRHEQWKEAKKTKGQEAPREPERPPMKRLIVEDITVEALSEVLRDNPRGVLCLQDELTGWFASMDAYKSGSKGASKDRAHWLEAYNGGRRSIDRITRGNVTVPNWSACMIGGIQPDMMRRVANNMGNDGLLQRFMVICARAGVRDADRTPNEDATERLEKLFDDLAQIQGSDEPVRLTEGAQIARERVSEYARQMGKAFDHPHMKAWLGKWDGLFARLLLTYHVIDCATQGVYPPAELVSASQAAKVERLMCGTLLPHAIHFYSEIMDAHDRQENIRQLARLILAKGLRRITKRDIAQQWKAARRLEEWEVRSIIDALCTMEWLSPDPDPRDMDSNGRPRSWLINPIIHEAFKEHAERERIRRHEAAQAIQEMRAHYIHS